VACRPSRGLGLRARWLISPGRVLVSMPGGLSVPISLKARGGAENTLTKEWLIAR